MNQLYSFILALVFSSHLLLAQQVEFTASVNKNPVSVGEPFKISFVLSNAKGSIEPPPFGDFQILSGPSQSSNYQFINGRASSSIELSYYLSPLAAGELVIAPATVLVDGKTYRTEPIVLKVGEGKGNTQNKATQQTKSDANVIAQMQLSKSEVFVGEQITATYLLYSRYNNLELSSLEPPTIDGFWTEEVDIGNANWESKQQIINGKAYRVAILKKQILIPQQSGDLQIDPMKLTCIVNRSFFSAGKKIEVIGNRPTIKVKALPHSHASSFDGSVGQFDLSVSTDRNQVKANEAINLRVRIDGRGHLQLISPPKIQFPQDFEVYDPEIQDNIDITTSGISGSRTFNYLIIPRFEGDYELPPIEFSYFDPKKKSYKTLSSKALVFNILANDLAPSAFSTVNKEDVTILKEDIRYLKTQKNNMRLKKDFFFGTSLYYTCLVSPVFALFIFLLIRRRRESLYSDHNILKQRKAARVAQKRLTKAKEWMAKENNSLFHQEIFKALYGYLSDKLSIPQAALSREKLEQQLSEYKVPPTLKEALFSVIDECEMARFAPSQQHVKQELYERALEVIQKLQNHLK